jgi:predicted HTH transcriptional regulator
MNLFTSRLDQIPFNIIEEFLGLNLPVDQRIPEGSRIDYNIVITQDLGDDVASFANVDGGLIFIGIRSDKALQNVPVEWPGLPHRADYGTQITSRILSTVNPKPDVDIGWATTPTGNFIYVVRVRAGTYPPYEYQQTARVAIAP